MVKLLVYNYYENFIYLAFNINALITYNIILSISIDFY